MPIGGRRCEIDLCIADIVAALNAANIKTVASCCGHGKKIGVIGLSDGRHINIYPNMRSWNKWEIPSGSLRLTTTLEENKS